MNRKFIGVLVIVVWVAGLGLLYRRATHRTLAQELTEVGMRVSPETYYYSLEKNGVPIGVAASSIDTSKTRVISSDLIRGKFPAGDTVFRIEARSEARFTRGMRLRDFVIRAYGDIKPFMIRGVMQEGEEKTLRVTTESLGVKPITTEAIADAPVFIPTMAPLPLLLRREPEIGDSINVSMYDPMSRSLHDVTMRIEADSLFLVADSAALDSASGRWVKVHQDSLRGWRITRRNGQLTAWVDASGRLIAASEPGGISMVRTAFEIAFSNWRLDNPNSAPIPKRRRHR